MLGELKGKIQNMKKIFLMGRSEAGKTSLTQALKGEKLHYIKTQYTNTNDDISVSGLHAFHLRQM